MGLVLEREELKALIKESVTEVLAQNRELFAEVVEEVLEDKRFMAALRAGESSDLVEREAIFEALEREG